MALVHRVGGVIANLQPSPPRRPMILRRGQYSARPLSAPNEIRPRGDPKLIARPRRRLVPRGSVGVPHPTQARRRQMPRRDLRRPARRRAARTGFDDGTAHERGRQE